MSQESDTVLCKGIPVVTNRSTIEGFSFTFFSPASKTSSSLSIKKEFFTNNFKLISSDPDWKVDGFWFSYDCENCDIYEKCIKGNIVDVSKYPIFKSLKRGELLEFRCINIVRGVNRFITLSFAVIVE